MDEVVKKKKYIIYTIGHSTRSIADFLKMLAAFNIKVLVDIRSLPGSRKFPQFNREELENSLKERNINYIYLADLGGRRKVDKHSKNNRWRNDSFKGYADYMETQGFKNGIKELKDIALRNTTAFMCAEAVWWRCHRSMVSDFLKAGGWTVFHIMSADKAEEHPYTQPARIIDGKVCYSDFDLSDTDCKEQVKSFKFKVGDKVKWNSEAGIVSGTIIKIHTADFDNKGYTRHASEREPQYEIKSLITNHIAVHKGSALSKL
ncbi:MAG: HVA1 family protein [Crocinitomicaceae bacterium]|nr:HVA1 family protein [Crocinitomicaceae bacterium]